MLTADGTSSATPVRFAHSLPDAPPDRWEMLSTHLGAVGDRAAGFASAFGWEEAARTAGRLHDVGKASAAFQAYIRGKGPSPDHSSAGAEAALAAYPGPLGRILAFLVAGHLHERSGSKYDF